MDGWMGCSSDAVYDDHDGIVSYRGVCRLHWTDEGTDAWNWYYFRVTYYLHFFFFSICSCCCFFIPVTIPLTLYCYYYINMWVVSCWKYHNCSRLTDWLSVCVSLGFIIFPCTFFLLLIIKKTSKIKCNCLEALIGLTLTRFDQDDDDVSLGVGRI